MARVFAAVWSLVISAIYLALAMVVPAIASGLVVAFVALLLVPGVLAEWKEQHDDGR